MNWLKERWHLNVNVKKKGSSFTKCIVCEFLMGLISEVGKNNIGVKEQELKSTSCWTHTQGHWRKFWIIFQNFEGIE